MTTPTNLEAIALQAAKAATASLLQHFDAPDLMTSSKGARLDIVTDADLASERAILSVITAARPGDGFIAEESQAVDSASGYTWVIDPLDSTANYSRRIPVWSISIAVQDDSGTLAAVVACPPAGEVFSMSRGGDLRCNGKVVPHRDISANPAEALAITGWDYRMSKQRAAVVAGTLIPLVGKVRAPGSPALGLTWTAAGRADLAYYEQPVAQWDIAAGLFFCEQQGYCISFRHSPPPEPHRLLVAPPSLANHPQLVHLVTD